MNFETFPYFDQIMYIFLFMIKMSEMAEINITPNISYIPQTRIIVHELPGHQNNIEIYQSDINRFRRLLDASNMLHVDWDVQLENASVYIGMEAMFRFGDCTAEWKCDSTQPCDPFLTGLVKQPDVSHIRLKPGVGFEHAMGYMYSFLGIPSPKLCGNRYERYWQNDSMCNKHAYKLYSRTNRVGCAQLICIDQDKGQTYEHFVCRFASVKMLDPVEGFTFLYFPASVTNDVCSMCPDGYMKCVDKLCSSGSTIFVPVKLLGVFVLFIIIGVSKVVL